MTIRRAAVLALSAVLILAGCAKKPAATEPVKATAWVRSEVISACAVAAPPGRQETRPSGSGRNTAI